MAYDNMNIGSMYQSKGEMSKPWLSQRGTPNPT